MDISYCGDKTGFPRPGHIYRRDVPKYQFMVWLRCFTVVLSSRDAYLVTVW